MQYKGMDETRADSPQKVKENPQKDTSEHSSSSGKSWWRSKLGNIITAGAIMGATAGVGVATHDTVAQEVGQITQNIEMLANPRPLDGTEVQKGVITEAHIVPLPKDAEGRALEPTFRKAPVVDFHNEIKKEQLASMGLTLTPETDVKGKLVLGGTFNSEVYGAFQKDKDGNLVPAQTDGNGHRLMEGPAYGKWLEIDTKDDKGEPTKLFVAQTFVDVVSQTQPNPQAGK